jgi:hypothetical protein
MEDPPSTGFEAACVALSHGHAAAAQTLLDNHPAWMDAVDQTGRTLLFHAITGPGHDALRLAVELIQAGACVHSSQSSSVLVDRFTRHPLVAVALSNRPVADRMMLFQALVLAGARLDGQLWTLFEKHFSDMSRDLASIIRSWDSRQALLSQAVLPETIPCLRQATL